MKAKKTVLLAGLAMSMVFATGCKNESSKAIELPKPAPITAQANLEMATNIKAQITKNSEAMVQTRKEIKEAKARQAELSESLLERADALVKVETTSMLKVVSEEIKTLEAKLKFQQDVAVYRRNLLNKTMKDMSPEDKLKIGEGDIESQVAYDEKLQADRIKLSYDAAVENRRNQELIVEGLAAQLKEKEDAFAALSAQDAGVNYNVMKAEYDQLEKQMQQASMQLTIAIALEENLAKALK